MVCGQVVSVTHHRFEPRGLTVQILHGRDFATEHTMVAILFQLSGKHQAGAIERENIEVVDHDCYTHALAENLDRLYVGKWASSHAKSNNVEGAGHSVAHHHVSKSVCYTLLEGEVFPRSPPTSQELKHPFGSMA